MSRFITAIMAFGVFVLLIGLIIPTAIDASHTNATNGFELSEGENTTITEGLRMSVHSISGDSANISLIDTQTRENVTQELTVGETQNYTTNGENTTVTLESISGVDTSTTVEYNRTYGWNDGSKLFVENLGLLIALLALLLVVGLLMAVI